MTSLSKDTAARDSLIAAMLPTIRDTFHLTLMPKKGETLSAAQALFGAASLGATLARAGILAARLNRAGDVCGVIGTTPEIIDGLRRLFADPAQGDLAVTLRRRQDDFNAGIDADCPAAQAIAPYLAGITPPASRPRSGGFGY